MPARTPTALTAALGLTPADPAAAEDTRELSDVTDDSRAVAPGSLFIARSTSDERWRRYVTDAISHRVMAVVAPGPIDVPAGVTLFHGNGKTPIDQRLAGAVAARFFGEPAKRLHLLGVTGTNGKTTVATLTQSLLRAAGVRCGLIGTVAIDTGGPAGPRPAELTTPGAVELQRTFAEMVEHGCAACAMEVSSHALHQGRADGLSFRAAVFTNLTRDHLDYHGTMDAYAAAKARLFRRVGPAGRAVLPRAAAAAARMLTEVGTGASLAWTTADPDAAWGTDYLIVARRMSAAGSRVTISGGGQREPFDADVPLIGEHNLRNLIQAIAAADAVAPLPPEALARAIAGLPPVPGRLEPVKLDDDRPRPAVLVDYAHTPDALENVLRALRPLVPDGKRLIVVFGCGGDRDRTKRPLMAQAACGLADHAVLTSDNPRTEDPQQILDDALAGADDAVEVEIDRAAAIHAAVHTATPGDTVLIAGKGHEDYQILGTKKIHFDDREHAAAALRDYDPTRAGA